MAVTEIKTPAPAKPIPEIEAWLDAHKITWHLDPALPVDKVDAVASLANQARLEQLNTDAVDRYTADMERGEIFPPIVVRKAGRKLIAVGGNHRLAAARAANVTTLAAYVTDLDDDQALLLAIEDNRRHGLPLTDDERVHHADALVNGTSASGKTYTIAEAAEICGVNFQKLRNVLAADRARQRCSRLDVSTQGMSMTTLAKLDSIDDDEQLAALGDAIASGAVLAKEVQDVVARVREMATTADVIAYLHEFTGGADGRVRPPTGHPPSATRQPRARLLIDLDRLLGYDADAVASDCKTPEQARQVANQVKAVARRLKTILDAVER